MGLPPSLVLAKQHGRRKKRVGEQKGFIEKLPIHEQILMILLGFPYLDLSSSERWSLQLCWIFRCLNLLRVDKAALFSYLIHDFHDENTLS